ncbi:hypothetical protein Hanom_Chr04g00286411 [Helianthus anomalus]
MSKLGMSAKLGFLNLKVEVFDLIDSKKTKFVNNRLYGYLDLEVAILTQRLLNGLLWVAFKIIWVSLGKIF